MSSNLSIKRVCAHCGKIFTAKTTVTKFCSDVCAKRNYKLRKRESNIQESNSETKVKVIEQAIPKRHLQGDVEQRELIDIKVLSAMTSMGERTLYRLVKDVNFPKLKIGKRLLFHKQTVIQYLQDKYGNL
jgi:predicted DNA-binding transcriptional regulator AlpA